MVERLTRTVRFTQAMIDAYGAFNGDNDIIHYDEGYAKGRGYRGTLNHGLHSLALAADLGMRRYGPRWLEAGRVSAKWTGPVCPGDELLITLEEDGTLRATVGDGQVVMVGDMRLVEQPPGA
jgi:acyl dehydratase